MPLSRSLIGYCRDNWPVILFGLLALLTIVPLLQPGYVLRFDMVFAPTLQLNLHMMIAGEALWQQLPLAAFLQLLNIFLPMDWVQKLLLWLILFGSTYVFYRAIDSFAGRVHVVARVLAAIAYTYNPFVFDRFMMGHWRFLLAYAFFPMVIGSVWRLLCKPSRRNLLWAAVAWVGIGLISLHHVVIVGLAVICLTLFIVRTKRSAGYLVLLVGVVTAASSWWLLPILLQSTSTDLQKATAEQLIAFASQPDARHGLWFTLTGLQGFWAAQNWQGISDWGAWWPIVIYVWLIPFFVCLAYLGSFTKGRRRMLYGLLLASGVSIVLAAGPAPQVASLNTWLFTHVPGLSAFREPQKFLSLLAFTYAVFAAYGIDSLLGWKHRLAKRVALSVILSMYVVVAWPFMWAAHGQLNTQCYPDSWQKVGEILDSSDEQAIVLPWHLYVDDTFVEGTVANPAKAFFGDRAIVSQRMNLTNLQDVERGQYESINEAIMRHDKRALLRAMDQIDASYILITNPQADTYRWLLDGENDWHVVLTDNQIILLQNNTIAKDAMF